MRSFLLLCCAGIVLFLALVMLVGPFYPNTLAGHLWAGLMLGVGDTIYIVFVPVFGTLVALFSLAFIVKE